MSNFESMFDFRFFRVPCKQITKESLIEWLDDDNTKRFNLEYNQPHAIRQLETGESYGKMITPFMEPVETILSRFLNIEPFLFRSGYSQGGYRYIKTEEEYNLIFAKLQEIKSLVFLRDNLDLSIALSMHESFPGVRTQIGQDVYEAKYNGNMTGLPRLTVALQSTLDKLPYFKDVDMVCCIPTQHPILQQIVSNLKGFSFSDISSSVYWTNKNDEIKGKTSEKKMELLEQFGLQIGIDVKEKTILLLDDMYQSGLTIQFVAMKLKEAGAKRVFGITLVKALGNE